jgi:hypothetical protein
MTVLGSIYKDQFASNTPEDVAVMLRPLTEALARISKTKKHEAKRSRSLTERSDVFPLYDVR